MMLVNIQERALRWKITILFILCGKRKTEQSSTWRELKTVSNFLESLYDDLKGKMVKLYTDNENVVKIVKKVQ